MWDVISKALAALGPEAMALNVANQIDPLLPPEAPQGAEQANQDEMVEYEGMLVSASAAQRRKYVFSIHTRSLNQMSTTVIIMYTYSV